MGITSSFLPRRNGFYPGSIPGPAPKFLTFLNLTKMENNQTKLEGLYEFAMKRPRISPADYAGYTEGYKKDSKEATKQRLVFLDLHRAVNSVLTAEEIEEHLEGYKSGKDRMHYKGQKWEYTAGQYWPLEYRAAAARILWGILYRYVAENITCDPAKIKKQLTRLAGRTAVNYFW